MRLAHLVPITALALATACGSVKKFPDVDASNGSGADAAVHIDAAAQTFTVTVSPAGNGVGTVTSTPTGITCGSSCSDTFTPGTSVTLQAVADANSTFIGWSGAGCSGTGPCTFDVTADVSVTATFATNNSVVVTIDGNGTGTVSSNPAGISCPTDCSEAYSPGQQVTLTATPTGDSYFAGWTGGNCSGTGTCTVTTDTAVGVTATFTLNQHALTVMKNGNGAGTVTSNPAGIDCGSTCSGSFDSGTMVTLTASPATGSSFTGWSGANCPGTGDCTVTVAAATTVTATFTLNQYLLTVMKSGTGSGTVTSNPTGINCGGTCSANFNYNTMVTLTASPVTGSNFTGWQGGNCSGTGTCTVTVTAATTVTATFTLQKRSITFVYRSFGGGTGSVTSNPAGVSCTGNCTQTVNFDYGSTVTLTKTPTGTPASLVYWSGDCTGTGACSLNMTANRTVTATFSHTNYIFVTVNTHNGDWGGSLANADAFCDAEAANAGLPGKYVAWISDSKTTADSRLGTARGWMRVDGLPFADTPATLVRNRKIFYPPRVDAKGNVLSGVHSIATGTLGDGTTNASQDCTDWTTSSSTVGMSGGIATGESGEWSQDSGGSCDYLEQWYCMGTDFTTAVTPVATPGRRAFVLSASYNPAGGIAKADSACQSEASQAGLANAAKFMAFMASTSASAVSRFNLAGTPWVRTDGIPVVSKTSDIATDSVLSAVDVQADGITYTDSATRIWGGAASGTAVGSAAETCNNWTATTGATATVGISGWGNKGGFAWNTAWSCTAAARVMCLEN